MSSQKVNVHAQRIVLTMAIISTLGSLLFGYNTGVINGALPYMARPDQLDLTPVLEGMVGSAICLGCAVGALAGGRIADLIGRKRTLMYLAVIFFAATLGCALSVNAVMMIAFRFVLGIAVGGASVTVPAYLAEIATENLRGSLVVMMELVIVSGQLLAYIINAVIAISFGDNPGIWRYLLGIASLPAILFFVGMMFNKESPRWLVTKGRVSEALEILKKTHETEMKAVAELNGICDLINEQKSQQNLSFKDFKEKWMKHILILGVVIGIIQQLTGVNGIMFYGSQILTTAGFSTDAALVGNIANGIISVVGTIAGFYLVRRLTRRRMLAVGLIGILCSNILLGIISTVLDGTAMLPYFVLTLTVVFLAFQQTFVSPVTWVVISEIFPLRMRGTGMGLAIFVFWLTVYAVTFTFPILIGIVGMSNTFFVFAVMGVLSLMFVKYCMPETKGLSMEEIERKFRTEYSSEAEKMDFAHDKI